MDVIYHNIEKGLRMRTALKVGVIALLLGLAFGSVSAQTKTPVVNKRERAQQARIRQGVKSGELTPGETRRLEARESKIQADKMAAKADGKVTPAERRKLNREQNRASRKIYRLKHNNNVNPKQ